MGLEAPRTDNLTSSVSSTSNSAGSALWAQGKNMNPLVDANCHTEAIGIVNDWSPIHFLPLFYKDPGFTSGYPAGQIILFGCPPELRIDEQQKTVPLILECLIGSGRDFWYLPWHHRVGLSAGIVTTSSLYGSHRLCGM